MKTRLSFLFALLFSTWLVPAAAPPNVVFILADDLGIGELGCYGQKKIKTPHIDRLATEGMRFTQCYSGANVCAPSRSTLLTGMHTGHTAIRGNGGGRYLYDTDITTAEVLKKAGYVNGGFGKWGLGTEDSPGFALKQGFDEWFGYYHQVHAHFYYPYYVWQNDKKFMLPENEGGKRGRFTHDEIQKQALDFIRRHKNERFFCYVPFTLPHVELAVPEDSMKPYRGKWPETPLPDPRPGYIGAEEPLAAHAGQIARLDDSVGQILALLKELKVDDNTIVFFTSDNGAQAGAWKRVVDFFEATTGLRGYKTEFYEGGIRVPMLARWPGKIKAGSTTDHICAFWDVMPTLAELAGTTAPAGIDGRSFAPTLLGKGRQEVHPYLYWEVRNPRGLVQAVRMGDWKAINPQPNAPLELYNLKTDRAEKQDVAATNPEIMKQIQGILASARTEERTYPAEQNPPKVKDYVR
jgi:arylsulfatase A